MNFLAGSRNTQVDRKDKKNKTKIEQKENRNSKKRNKTVFNCNL